MIRPILRGLVDGPAAVQLRRFVVVGTMAAGVQLLLWGVVDVAGWNYLVGAVVAIETTVLLQYALNNAWTFQAKQNTRAGRSRTPSGWRRPTPYGDRQYRYSPACCAFSSKEGRWYLPANVVAIAGSGLYRFLLDARWT